MVQTIQAVISKTGNFSKDAIEVSIVGGEVRRLQNAPLVVDGRYFVQLLTGEEGQIEIRNRKVTWL